MTSARIVVVDTGMGNLASVTRALGHVGAAEVVVTSDPNLVRSADAVVMPGQGAFRDCSRALEGGLGEAVKESIARGAPFLGICLGLQILFAESEEADASCRGLGVFAGRVVRLGGGTDALTGARLPLPHTGWNLVERARGASILAEDATHFYFVHSYAVVPDDAAIVAATTEYGARFVSAIAKDNVLAVQFHPEKSQKAGLELLRRWVASS
ncbi:imidazole glycerol phosphate synthase subunit HisH [soil metagenome]